MLSKALRAQYRAAGLRAPRQHPEQDFQITAATYLNKYLPDPYWYTAIDHTFHGERRGKILREMGVKKGLLDIGIFGPECFVGWLENKSLTGTLRPDQEALIAMFKAFGHHTAVCRTLEDMIAAVSSWGIQWLSEPRNTTRIKSGLRQALAAEPTPASASTRKARAPRSATSGSRAR